MQKFTVILITIYYLYNTNFIIDQEKIVPLVHGLYLMFDDNNR